jgi:hypothetical protein
MIESLWTHAGVGVVEHEYLLAEAGWGEIGNVTHYTVHMYTNQAEKYRGIVTVDERIAPFTSASKPCVPL